MKLEGRDLSIQTVFHCSFNGKFMDGSTTRTERHHAKRLLEAYRSEGCPYRDIVEVELIAVNT